MKISFKEGQDNLESFVSAPIPAKLLIPKWYKDIKPTNEISLKHCLPFFDALSAGYIQTTWAEMSITKNNNGLDVSINGNVELCNIRDKPNLSITDEFYQKEFIWRRHWISKLPKGYSLLITHPLNRLDLPFMTVSAIVDSDNFYHRSYGNIPFYLKKDFQGVIPKGTPMYQIIPFKRDNWERSIEKYDLQESLDNDIVMESIGEHPYKKKFWQRKDYK